MFCGHCGTKIPEGAKFCPSCGEKADAVVNSEPSPMPPEPMPPAPAPAPVSPIAPAPLPKVGVAENFATLNIVEKATLIAALVIGVLMMGSSAVALFSNFGKVTDLMGMYSGAEPMFATLLYFVLGAVFFGCPLDALMRAVRRLGEGSMNSSDWKFIAVQFGSIVVISLVIVAVIGPYAEENTFHSTMTMCMYAFMKSIWPEVSVYAIPCGALAIACAYSAYSSPAK